MAQETELLGLESVLTKLRHAFALRDQFRDVLAELQSARRLRSRRDNCRDSSSRTAWVEWVLESESDYTEASLLLGDVVHNLRAAMDYAVWAITPAEIQEQRPTDVAFPLYSTPKQFRDWVKKRVDWYGPTVFAVIEANQPFNTIGSGQLDPLHILQVLSNTDKHRLLNIVIQSQVDLGGVTVDPMPPGGFRSKVTSGPVSKGSVLARIEFERPPGGKFSIDLRAPFGYEQVLRYVDQDNVEHWLPIGDAMNSIGSQVRDAAGLVLSAHAKDSGEVDDNS
ncbi:hypothetical protein [Mycolicibacterium sp. YH-1]|uniref:hypothetical protein n=1 Tax=Mycolicibacterium sp. YH-1 TaxID=2908837 RepID=UPI001F4BE749|nr:hypothetical protein [Mycolicibacterium sp. YH-1]UNB52979.1 hypothetical protein L0M16_00925 [Mycolicibacterium sp. YH-1]